MKKVVLIVEAESNEINNECLELDREITTLRIGQYNKLVCYVTYFDNREPEVWLEVFLLGTGYNADRMFYSSNCWEPFEDVDFSCNGLFDKETVTDIKKMLEVAR